MLNTLLQSLSENNLVVLVVLLFLFIRLQFCLHREMVSVRKDMTDGFAEVRKEVSDTRGDLRNDIGKVSERVARIEGRLGLPPPCDGKKRPGTPPGDDAMPKPDPVAGL